MHLCSEDCRICEGNFHLEPYIDENSKWFDDNTNDHEIKYTCEPNECICPNGTRVNNENCLADGHIQCQLCNDYYRLIGSQCLINSCECDFGNTVPDGQCDFHGSKQCASCNDGYHLVGTTCEHNFCICNNGTPRRTGITSVACAQHGRNECHECNAPNFQLVSNGIAFGCSCAAGYEGDSCQISTGNWVRYPASDVNSAYGTVLPYSGITSRLYYTINISSKNSWVDCRDVVCPGLGGTFASITSQYEQEFFVSDYFQDKFSASDYEWVWLGAKDTANTNGQFRWLYGKSSNDEFYFRSVSSRWRIITMSRSQGVHSTLFNL